MDASKSLAARVRVALMLSLLAAVLAGPNDAAAQSRFVFVNGVRLSDAEIATFDRRQCTMIPNGSYWLNTQTGAWGYAGNPQVQGIVGDGCRAAAGGTNLDGTLGPFATMRRAEEVANGYRQRGQRAVSFHNGDGYYVRVSR